MSVQILGGRFKGYSVQVPASGSRPTTVMLRRRIFDRYQNLSSFSFVDALAGSGSVGLEALSRGATSVIFVESQREAISLLKKNIQGLMEWAHIEKEILPIRTFHQDVTSFLREWGPRYRELSIEERIHTILFFDPPYGAHGLYENLKRTFFENVFFQGELWIESDVKKGVPLEFWPKEFPPTKIIRQGHSYLAIFQNPHK
ncbi:MAG: RsmD family RNA methyltransferase [Bdellovibrio sp.]|nr:RsmD family RNA methyltransferase [Bdellovibrio sp.]